MTSDLDRVIYPAHPVSYDGGTQERNRTPLEVVSDGYMGVVQIASLNAITQLGMESVRQCDLKRLDVLAEHPNLEAPITGLLYNHARLVASIQSGIVDGENGRKLA